MTEPLVDFVLYKYYMTRCLLTYGAGHTRGWLGQPDLLAECGDKMRKNTGVFDITKESTYSFLREFHAEIREVFKDKVTHLGGDEVSVKCW